MYRRNFLKITSASIVGGAALASGWKKASANQKDSAYDQQTAKSGTAQTVDRVVPTFCEICFWKCGVLAHVKDDRIVKLTGNPKHPLSNGKLCPRGVGGIGAIYDEDRLRTPLKRIRVNGEEKWQAVSWEDALDHTARKLNDIKAKYGPGKVALYSHGHGGSFFKTLIKSFGSGIIAAPSYDQCRGPRATGYTLTMGQDVGSPELLDVGNSKCVAFIGSHLGENMHNTAVQDVAQGIDNGAVFITVDPRFSVIAGKSKYWLPIKPGTDIALLQAWSQVIIYEDLYDKEFVDSNAFGFDEYKDYVKDKTPEWAFIETGIQPDIIRATARELAKNAPASFVHPGRHVVWYGDDTQRSRLIALVNALLGNWGKKGGVYLPNKFSLAKYSLPSFPELESCDCPTVMKYPLASEALAQGVCDASVPSPLSTGNAKTESYIKAWIVYGCNVPMTLPDTKRVIEIMRQLDFVVAIDTMPAEVTAYADVVLPECTYLERYDDLHNPPFRTPYVAIRQPVVEPMYDSKPGWWIAKQLAKRMGLEQYFPWSDIKTYLKKVVADSGQSFDQLQKDGAIVGKGQPIYDPSKQMQFRTPSGKIEFLSNGLAAVGHDPIPAYTKHEQPPNGYFRLLFGRSPVHTFTRTTNNKQLLELYPENELWINSEMAKIMGFKNGQRVMVENQDGVKTGPIKLKATQRIRQDCVYMVHGFGRTDKRLRAGYGRGASDSYLVTRVKRDPIMGGTGMNVNFVTIYKEV